MPLLTLTMTIDNGIYLMTDCTIPRKRLKGVLEVFENIEVGVGIEDMMMKAISCVVSEELGLFWKIASG